MKSRLFTSILVCITALLTFWIFLDFQKRWKAAAAFHAIVSDAPISIRHLFISPKQLGVHAWDLGDYAAYQLRTKTRQKQISFHVAAQEAPPSRQHWVRTKGLVSLNGVDIEIWRLLNVQSLRPGSEKAEVLFANGSIPFPLRQRRAPVSPVSLEHVGEEAVDTAIGTFTCQHYFVQLQAPDGTTAPLLELWATPAVPPLGIVRARWRDEVLELVQTQTLPPPELPEMLSKTINTRKGDDNEANAEPLASVCAQCHEPEMGGKHLTLKALTTLSGVELDFTQALYHSTAAGLTRPHNSLSLQLISLRGKRLASGPVRFTWEKGSFRVQTDLTGRLVLSLDETAHRGNVRVNTREGRLVLNVAVEGM